MVTHAEFRAPPPAAHSLAELLACPAQAGDLLSGASEIVEFDAACVVFRQHEACRGLYLLASGSFTRSAIRLNSRVELGRARSGELVELAAALGDGRHTYTLTAISAAAVLLLPMASLLRAFEIYPPLRMHLLEQLAREVSQGYVACCRARIEVSSRSSRAKAV